MADEPTGSLDSKTGAQVMEMLVSLNEKRGITVVLVTHDSNIASYGKRVIGVLDGLISSDGSKETVKSRVGAE